MTAPAAARGEIWTVDLGDRRGRRQRYLALVIQNDTGNQYAVTTIVAAITSPIATSPITVPLEKGEGGLDRRSMVDLSHIFTIDKASLRRRLGRIAPESMESVDRAIKISLDVG